VFADRPASYAVPRHREAEVIAYIHNNPVRAGLVARARESSWSSHQAYVGLVARPAWLDVREGLRRAGCGADSRRFDELVAGSSDATLELPDLEAARAAARRQGPYEVGTPTLSEPCEVPIVCRPFVRPRASASAVLAAVATRAGIPVLEASRKHARGPVSMVKRKRPTCSGCNRFGNFTRSPDTDDHRAVPAGSDARQRHRCRRRLLASMEIVRYRDVRHGSFRAVFRSSANDGTDTSQEG
jgi:hypothetical protein